MCDQKIFHHRCATSSALLFLFSPHLVVHVFASSSSLIWQRYARNRALQLSPVNPHFPNSAFRCHTLMLFLTRLYTAVRNCQRSLTHGMDHTSAVRNRSELRN